MKSFVRNVLGLSGLQKILRSVIISLAVFMANNKTVGQRADEQLVYQAVNMIVSAFDRGAQIPIGIHFQFPLFPLGSFRVAAVCSFPDLPVFCDPYIRVIWVLPRLANKRTSDSPFI